MNTKQLFEITQESNLNHSNFLVQTRNELQENLVHYYETLLRDKYIF
jgi:hypothetical protein